MIFTEIEETATVTLFMDDLAAMARACRAADECGAKGYTFAAAANMFTMAAMIASEHGNMSQEMTARLEKTRKRIVDWE